MCVCDFSMPLETSGPDEPHEEFLVSGLHFPAFTLPFKASQGLTHVVKKVQNVAQSFISSTI